MLKSLQTHLHLKFLNTLREKRITRNENNDSFLAIVSFCKPWKPHYQILSLTNWKCILRSIRHPHHGNYQHLLHLQSARINWFLSVFFHLCSSSSFGIHPCHLKIDIPSLNLARFFKILFDSKMDLLLKNVSDDIARMDQIFDGRGHSRGLAKNMKYWGVVNIYCKTHSRYYLRFCVLVWSALSATNPQASQKSFFQLFFFDHITYSNLVIPSIKTNLALHL